MGTVTVYKKDVQGVLLGFCRKNPSCRFIECSETGYCNYHCTESLSLDCEIRSKQGFGAGDNAYLPSGIAGETGGPDDFVAGVPAWNPVTLQGGDPHDGDFDDRQLPIF